MAMLNNQMVHISTTNIHKPLHQMWEILAAIDKPFGNGF